MSLDTVTQSFARRCQDFTGLDALVKFDFGEDGSVCIDATQSPPVLPNEEGEADCIIRVSLGDMERLMEGRLNPTLAYTMGRLRVDGSLGVAMKLASRLEE